MSKMTIDSETLEKLHHTSIEERIGLIEMLLGTLKNDLKKDTSHQPESEIKYQRPAFGFMKDTGQIIGDVLTPIGNENTWEVLQ
jgi:hypothetical protein